MNKNVNLSKHTLFRFNILCVMRDTADPTEDEEIARKREDDLLPGQVGEDSLEIRLRPHSSRDSRGSSSWQTIGIIYYYCVKTQNWSIFQLFQQLPRFGSIWSW